MKCYQSCPGIELVSPCPYPVTITITPQHLRWCYLVEVWSSLLLSISATILLLSFYLTYFYKQTFLLMFHFYDLSINFAESFFLLRKKNLFNKLYKVKSNFCCPVITEFCHNLMFLNIFYSSEPLYVIPPSIKELYQKNNSLKRKIMKMKEHPKSAESFLHLWETKVNPASLFLIW